MNVKIKYHLYEWRCQRNLSIRQLERLSGVSKSTINNIENGSCDPSIRTICLLAGSLKVQPERLYSYRFTP